MATPTVSVVIPTLGDPLVEDALDSAAAQSYDAIETVVVDGSGADRFEDLHDRIDVYEFQDPRGLSAARNRGIDLASGEYVAFLDEDDLLTPGSVADRVGALQAGADLAYGDWFDVSPEFGLGDPTEGLERRTALPVGNQARQHVRQFAEQGLRPSAVMARAECFERHRFDPDLRMAEDFHLWVRMVRDFRVRKVDTPVLYYRLRAGSLSRGDRDAYRRAKFDAIRDLEARYPELRPHADRLRAREWYLHGREKLAAGETHGALRAAGNALENDPGPRAALLVAACCLPLPAASKDRLFGALERSQPLASRVRRRVPGLV